MRVFNSVKFSYNISKGSIQDRKELVSRLNDKFFDAFLELSADNKKMKLKNLSNLYGKILPEKKNIKVNSLSKKYKDCDGASDYIYDEMGRLQGLTLEIPTNMFGKSKASLVTIIHENTHVLDTLAQPKHTALLQKMVMNGKYTTARNKWFQNELYNSENISSFDTDKIKKRMEEIEHLSRKFIKKKSIQDKIDYLNDARYELEQEQNAHAEQLRFAKKLKSLGRVVERDDLEDYDRVYLFTEKINVLKKILREILTNERKELAEKYKK